MRISNQEYEAMLARMRGQAIVSVDSVKARKVSREVERELKLQDAISAYCKSKGWLYLRSNPSMPTGRMPGEPDFLVLPGGGRMIWIECKTSAGKLSKDQRSFIAWANKQGVPVHVVRTLAEFMEVSNATS